MSYQVEIDRASILVVEDEPVNLTAITEVLRKLGHKILVATSGEKALRIIEEQPPELILLDIYMPGQTGIDVCRTIKGNSERSHIPVLFLTGSEQDLEEAFDAGGVDYILKPFKVDELIARVNTHLKISRLMTSLEAANLALEALNSSLEDKVRERTRELVATNSSLRKEINERRHLQDKLEYLSRYDFITRMFNRSSLEEYLAAKLIESRSISDSKLYFLYIDLDHFRVVNDTCGHIAGDELLRQLAELIKGLLVEGDICARLGGDEFALVFYKPDNAAAVQKAQNIKAAIEGFHFHWEHETFQVGVSIGLIEMDESFDNSNHLLSIAERTCLESKKRGGGEISVYNMTKEHIDNSKKQMRWVPIIQRAVEHNNFFLCGQVISSINSRDVNKMEVLIRLETPEKKILPPGHFIPIAERYHLITAVDKWVLQNVLEQKALIAQGYQFSVNVSGETINKESFSDFAETMISEAGVPGEKICFEITETSALSNLAATQKFIERMRGMGCQFALDDFGVGTSSYGYLKELSIDFLKIDGIFVRDLEHEKINRMMVESITSISNEMGIKVIAECVESPEALALLKDMGVDYAQGFFLHKPTRLSLMT